MKIKSLMGLKKIATKESVTKTAKTLPFSIQHQQQKEWCWLACSVSVSHYYSKTSSWKQCELANVRLNVETCCQDGSSDVCDKPGMLNDALATVGHYAKYIHGKIPLAMIGGEMNAARPLGMRIGWKKNDIHKGGGHFIVLYGYSDGGTENKQYLNVGDPWYGTSIQPYANFPSRYHGGGAWTGSFFTTPEQKAN